MPDLFEDYMRTNDPALGDSAEATPFDSIAARAEADDVTDIKARRPHWGRRIAVAAAAVAVAGALTFTMFANGPTETAEALTVDKVLTKAAQNATDPPTKAGQYWKLTHVYERISSSATAPGDVADACLTKSTDTVYIPVDGESAALYDYKTVKVKQIVGSKCELSETWAFTSDVALNDEKGTWHNPNAPWIAALPQTVDGLREELYADTKGAGSTPDNEAFLIAKECLETGMVPAKTRAQLFELLKTIPDTKITAESVAMGDRTGVAIAHVNKVPASNAGYEEETTTNIVIDKETGELLGSQPRTEKVNGQDFTLTDVYTPRIAVDSIPDSVQKRAIRYECQPDGGACVDPNGPK